MNPLISQFICLWSYLLHVFPLTIQKTNREVTKHIPQPGQGHTHLNKNPYHPCGGDNGSCFCLPRPHQWLPFTLGFSIFCLSMVVLCFTSHKTHLMVFPGPHACAQPITWAVAAIDSCFSVLRPFSLVRPYLNSITLRWQGRPDSPVHMPFTAFTLSVYQSIVESLGVGIQKVLSFYKSKYEDNL